MKKYPKIIILSLVMPFLGSCSNAPKFADYGSEITYEKFVENMATAMEKVDLLSTENYKNTGSFKGSYDVKAHGVESVLRGKEERYNCIEDDYLNEVCNFDSETMIFDDAYKGGASVKTNELGNKKSVDGVQKVHSQLHKISKDNKNYIVAALEETNEYSPVIVVPEGIESNDLLKYAVQASIIEMALDNFYTELTKYISLLDEQKASYKFYENGSTYTYVVEEKIENKEAIYNETETLAVINGSSKDIYQLCLNDDISYKEYHLQDYKVEIKTQYTEDTDLCTADVDTYIEPYLDSFIKGDVLTFYEEQSVQCSIKFGKAKVKSFDLGKMQPNAFMEE